MTSFKELQDLYKKKLLFFSKTHLTSYSRSNTNPKLPKPPKIATKLNHLKYLIIASSRQIPVQFNNNNNCN